MKVRFLADANLNNHIIRGLHRREPSVNFRTANEAGLATKTDLEVLRIAARSGRVLVTHDRKTMPSAFLELTSEEQSASVLIVPQDLELRFAIEDVLLVWVASEAEEWINLIASPLKF